MELNEFVIQLSDLYLLAIILFVSILFSAFIAIPLINILYRLKIVRGLDVDFSAIIDSRLSKSGTPVMGGLIFVIVIIVVTALLNLNGSTKVPLIVFAISAILGGIDDVLNIFGKNRKVRPLTRTNKLIKVHANPWVRVKLVLTYPWTLYKNFFFMLGSNPGKGIQAHEKILINAIGGYAVYYWIVNLTGWSDPNVLYFPFGWSIDIGFLMLPFVILTVLTMTNAVNIADGMDGLSAGMLLPALISFLFIALLEHNLPIAGLIASAIGGIIVYIYFNIPPARVQMGDVGSLAMGTLLAVVALEMRLPFLLVIIGAPFLVEFMSSLIQGITRRLIGRRLLKMAPLHHHFEMLGWKEEKVVMRFWLFSIISAFAGIAVYLLYLI